MKKIGKVLSIGMAAMMLLTTAGCGGKQTAENGAVTNGEKRETWVTEKPLTLTIHYSHSSGGPFKDDYVVFQEAAKATNVNLKGTVPLSNSEHDQSFNTMMVSGELSDIITTRKSNFEKYADVGAFVELDR